MPTKNEPIDLTRGQITCTLTVIQSVAAKALECYRWATQNRPHLVHLALHAKKGRARTKNRRRIIREFMEERYG